MCCACSVQSVDRNVWNQLKDMENSIALKYQWAESHSNHVLLKAIHVDTRNMVSEVSRLKFSAGSLLQIIIGFFT